MCDANGIAIIDVTSAASPKYLSNFGQYDVNGAGQGCAIDQGDLLAFSSGLLNVYNLTPFSLARIGQSQFYFGDVFLSGTMAYISTAAYNADAMFNIITQTGDFYIYDLTNPVLPKLDAQLVQVFLVPGSADTSPRGGLTVFINKTAIVLGNCQHHQWTSPLDHDRRDHPHQADCGESDADPQREHRGEPRHAGNAGAGCRQYHRSRKSSPRGRLPLYG
jgi:hypothetical protein